MTDAATPETSAPAAPALTELQVRVLAAYRALLARSTRPTVDLIRVELGGGSFRDLGPALKVVREHIKKERAEVKMPAEAAKELGSLADKLYSARYDEAGRHADTRHAEAVEEHRTVQADLSQAYIEMRSMETQLAELTELLRLANERADQNAAATQALQNEFTAHVQRAEADLRLSQQDTRDARDEAAAMRGQRDEVQSQLHAQKTISQELQARLDAESSNRQRLEGELADEIAAHKGTAASSDKKDARIAELVSQSKLDKQALDAANRERDAAVAEAARQRSQVEQITKQNGELSAVIAQAQSTISDMQKTATALPERLDQLIKAVSQLPADSKPASPAPR